MTDQVLNLLKFVLLGLLYLFFARVLWAVWSEVRTPTQRPVVGNPKAPKAQVPRPHVASPNDRAQSKQTKQSSKQSKKTARGRASRLVILEPKARRGMSIALTGDVTLGREPGCTIMIDDDAFVSQLHLRVFDYEGQPMVEDLGSTNGTFHNGSKLVGAKLVHPGDRIQVGTTLIEAQ
ncbi:MAG TPA: FHA domain-containing protein [Ilumatobacteraceae bacterium]|nr:FHA domain-containing protein [Ilumatobacteraceae bacterium]